MRCPFLREAQVKFCRASAHRKMILRSPGESEPERCLSPEHATCPAAKDHHEDSPSLDHCPFLHESLVQYCAAAPIVKYVPWSESLLSKCGTDSHTYCNLFATLQPKGTSVRTHTNMQTDDQSRTEIDTYDIDGIIVPANLWYAPNHCWLDIHDDGSMHIGIDAFAASVLGSAERISFVTTSGLQQPSVVFTVCGVDVQFVFPQAITITATNSYLRSDPSRLFSDPYVLGWLFEATSPRHALKSAAAVTGGLFTGRLALRWMEAEIVRMNRISHTLAEQFENVLPRLVADGGRFSTGMLQLLSREDILRLVSQFFSPLAQWRK
jgi:glycine cleavage system H lipoate-binding protein